MIAYEFFVFSKFDKAVEFANYAKAVAAGPLERGHAYWLIAQIDVANNNLVDARKNFEEVVMNIEESVYRDENVNIYAEWMGVELRNNECPHAEKVYDRLTKALSEAALPPQAKMNHEQNYYSFVSSLPDDCGLDWSLDFNAEASGMIDPN